MSAGRRSFRPTETHGNQHDNDEKMLEFRTDTGSFLVGGERAVAETEAPWGGEISLGAI